MKKLLFILTIYFAGYFQAIAHMQVVNVDAATNGPGSYNSGVDEARYKEYESQLNQVYQKLLQPLDRENRQKLIAGQEEWVKKRDSIVPANQSDPYKEKSAETLARTGVLMMVQKEIDKNRSSASKEK